MAMGSKQKPHAQHDAPPSTLAPSEISILETDECLARTAARARRSLRHRRPTGCIEAHWRSLPLAIPKVAPSARSSAARLLTPSPHPSRQRTPGLWEGLPIRE